MVPAYAGPDDRGSTPMNGADCRADFTAHVEARQPAPARLDHPLSVTATRLRILQNALAKVYRHWDRIETVELPDAYERRIIVNENNSRWRRLARRRESLASHVIEVLDPPAAAHRGSITAQVTAPDQQRCSNEGQCEAGGCLSLVGSRPPGSGRAVPLGREPNRSCCRPTAPAVVVGRGRGNPPHPRSRVRSNSWWIDSGRCGSATLTSRSTGSQNTE